MTRLKQATLPDPPEDDTGEEAASESDTFDKILDNLSQQKGSGIDANAILAMRESERMRREEKEARREEREARRHTMMMIVTMMTPLLPVLVEKIFGKKDDTMVTKLLEGIMAKGNSTDMIKEVMTVMATANSTLMQTGLNQIASVAEHKDRMHQEELDRLRDREDEEHKPANPIVEGISEVTKLIQSMRKPADSLNASGPGLDDPTPGAKPIQPRIAQRPAPIVMMVQTLFNIHTKGMEITAQQRARLRTGLVVAIQEDEKLCKAILDGDRNALIAMATPVVTADANLMAWIVKPGVEGWILAYIGKQIGPALDELVNAEEYANEPDEPEEPSKIDATTGVIQAFGDIDNAI